MRQKTHVFIAVLTALAILSGCGSASSSAHSDQKVSEDVITQELENGISQSNDAVSEYFTNDQLENMKRALKIPEDLPVEAQIGELYYWEGGAMDLVQVDFYHEGEYIAGAAFEPYKEDLVRNIYQYMGD